MRRRRDFRRCIRRGTFCLTALVLNFSPIAALNQCFVWCVPRAGAASDGSIDEVSGDEPAAHVPVHQQARPSHHRAQASAGRRTVPNPPDHRRVQHDPHVRRSSDHPITIPQPIFVAILAMLSFSPIPRLVDLL